MSTHRAGLRKTDGRLLVPFEFIATRISFLLTGGHVLWDVPMRIPYKEVLWQATLNMATLCIIGDSRTYCGRFGGLLLSFSLLLLINSYKRIIIVLYFYVRCWRPLNFGVNLVYCEVIQLFRVCTYIVHKMIFYLLDLHDF